MVASQIDFSFSLENSQKSALMNDVDPSNDTLSDPIILLSDSSLLEQAATHGWKGDGSTSNPFVIERVRIVTNSICFQATDISLHFVLRDSILESDNEVFGSIYLNNVTNGQFENCTIVSRQYAICVKNSENCTFRNNIIENTAQYAFFLRESSIIVVSNNTISGGRVGIGLEFSRECELLWNKVSGVSTIGVSLTQTEQNTISYNSIIGCEYGLRSEQVINSTFNGNLMSENQMSGFDADHILDCDVIANSIQYNGRGLVLRDAHNCKIINNTVNHNSQSGLLLTDSEYDTVSCNEIFDNEYSGISLSGIDYVQIHTNVVYGNGDAGLLMSFCNNVFIQDNMIHGNLNCGIRISQWNEQNILYENSIGWNDHGNAVDNCNKTVWDNGIDRGNSWSDYNGSGVYSIKGAANNIDRFPSLFIDTFPPRINHPPDQIFYEGTQSHRITWTPIEYEPSWYEVFKNSTPIELGNWDGSAITITLEPLKSGVYEYVLTVYDQNGQSANDSVLVIVLANTSVPQLVLSPFIILAIIGGLGVITIVVFLEIKARYPQHFNFTA